MKVFEDLGTALHVAGELAHTQAFGVWVSDRGYEVLPEGQESTGQVLVRLPPLVGQTSGPPLELSG